MNIAVLTFAFRAHEGQVRKYTGLPYITHPVEVAGILERARAGIFLVHAGLLHDVVEDTEVTLAEIEENFGPIVAALVDGMTDKTTLEDGNRATRKRLDRERLGRQSPDVKTIKLADIISNTKDIVPHDPGFARVYVREIDLLLGELREGDAGLWDRARRQIDKVMEEMEDVKMD